LGDGVLALFPLDPAALPGWCCNSYSHVGQHGAADYNGCIGATRTAKPAEYADLKHELEGRGYRLKVVKRRPNQRGTA
jgi:hypothetical protein